MLGFETQQQTLFCGNLGNEYILQVTASAVSLINLATHYVSQWKTDQNISVVSCNLQASQIVVATRSILHYLEIHGEEIAEKAHLKMEYEIACLDISPVEGKTSTLCAVGLWTDISVR